MTNPVLPPEVIGTLLTSLSILAPTISEPIRAHITAQAEQLKIALLGVEGTVAELSKEREKTAAQAKRIAELTEALANLTSVIKAGGAISASEDKIGFAFKLHEAVSAADTALAASEGECETCGGSGKSRGIGRVSSNADVTRYAHLNCPDCNGTGRK